MLFSSQENSSSKENIVYCLLSIVYCLLSIVYKMNTEKMQALLVEAGTMVVGEWPKPTPGPGELLVAVKAAGINRADLLQKSGKYSEPYRS